MPGERMTHNPLVQDPRAPGEADSRTEELAALVEHALLDYLAGPVAVSQSQRRTASAVSLGFVLKHSRA